jgi:hypothetical protein
MTDEERQKLVAALRTPFGRNDHVDEVCAKAADEIERLAAAKKDLEADQPTIVRALLREARPYVASAKGDDDPETHNLVDGLLRDIDAALAERGDND